MNRILLEKYSLCFNTDDVYKNIEMYFDSFDRRGVFEHTLDVVNEVEKLSEKCKFDRVKCKLAAYMHDLGRVVNNEEMVQFCEENGHEFVVGEKILPSILHQSASKIIANQVFGVKDKEILEALMCHTTLRSDPTEVDIIVFLADKLSWKEEIHQGLIETMRNALDESKEKAVFCYLEELYNKRNELKCYHEWSKEAYEFLGNQPSRTIF